MAAEPDNEAPGRDRGLDQARMRRLLGYNIAQAALAAYRPFDRKVLEPFGLRRAEYTILVLLDSNTGVTPKKLCVALAIASSNMTVLLDRLEKRGLLRRERRSTDARTQHVLLTPAGRLQVQKAEAAILAAEQELLRPFSPGERALLFELLQRVAAQRSR